MNKMRLANRTLALSLVVFVSTIACDPAEESIGDSEAPATFGEPSPTTLSSSQPSQSPRPTAIPDELVLREFLALPIPPGAERRGEGIVQEGDAMGGFSTNMTPQEVFGYYAEELLPLGWISETEPIMATFPDQGAGITRTAGWALTRDDYRLMIMMDLTPKNLPAGQVATQLVIEPVSESGLNDVPAEYITPIILPDPD
jgi:hypothetical protein